MFNLFRKLIISVIFLSLSSITVFSFSVFMPDDSEVSELVLLYTKAGVIFPDASYPLSLADLDVYALRLFRLTDNRKIRNQISIYINSLNFEKGRVISGYQYSLNPSVYIKGETYIPDTDTDLEHTRYPNDFYNRFVNFPDVGYLGLSAGVQGESGLNISLGLKREYQPEIIVNTNMLLSPSDVPVTFDNYFVRKGYLAWKTGNFEFRFGRAPVHYGDARFSTFLPSKRLPWLDTFTYRYEVGPLTMTSYFGTIDSRITDDERMLFLTNSLGVDSEYGAVTFLDDNGNTFLKIAGDLTDYSFQNTLILNSMHRFVLGWEKLRLGFTSSIVVARENNTIQIGDIFPVFIWHNAVLGSNNMNLVFDAGYALVPGLSLYGQAAWDDINIGDLVDKPDSPVPTIGAYLFGVSYVPGWMENLNLSSKLEIGTTHYLWGNYYAYDNWKGSYFSRAIYRYQTQQGYFWMPLTSPYGPGTLWVEGEADLEPLNNIKVIAGFTYLNFNSDVNLFTTPYYRDSSLEGYDSTSFSIYLESKYRYILNSNSEISFSLNPILYSYNGYLWPEFKISVELSGKKISDF
ncbi:MAG: hypothetical protein KAH95_17230 [Spirochaetales bacterium]|nr:hypothetical protein [Spirochaetales bacterium]